MKLLDWPWSGQSHPSDSLAITRCCVLKAVGDDLQAAEHLLVLACQMRSIVPHICKGSFLPCIYARKRRCYNAGQTVGLSWEL